MHKRVLITGASGGIGLAAALEAARSGFEVFATVHTDAGIATVEDAFADAELPVNVSVLDVTDAEQCEAAIELSRPYALVNNAGIGNAGAVEDVDIEAGRHELDVMAIGPTRLATLALPHMREQGAGRIVNVSSLGGRTNSPLTGWYTASKHALESLSDSLRAEIRSDNITVSVIEPGGVTSGMLEKAMDSVPDDSRFTASYERAVALTRATHRLNGDVQAVARVIVRAIESPRPKARYVVGVDARLLLLGGAVFPGFIKDRFKRKMLKL